MEDNKPTYLDRESTNVGVGFWASQVQGVALVWELKKLHATRGNYCAHCQMVDCPTMRIVARYDLTSKRPSE